jgi:predicted alpha/beta-fold hydrolase
MPLIHSDPFKSPYVIPNGHFETIYPSFFRRVNGVEYERERITTPDGDFLDLDWSRVGSQRLLIVSHGLEGNSGRDYVKGFVKWFNRHGWDALAWNCRSCSGEMNCTPKLYHHGAWYDLDSVINHVLAKGIYSQIALAGVSMGGSITLRYLGEKGDATPKEIIGATAFSVPCYLQDSVKALERRGHRFYANRFIKKLKAKLLYKANQFPDLPDHELLQRATTFEELDEAYSIRVYGFSSPAEFYDHITVYHSLPKICRPALVVNSLNDPMLIDKCFPYDIAEASNYFHLQVTKHGGHMGFQIKGSEHSWAEMRALQFLEKAGEV